MGIFGKKKEEKKTAEVAPKATKVKAAPKAKSVVAQKAPNTKTDSKGKLSNVILRPRITEKGAIVADEVNAYVFDVEPTATKASVKQAIQQIYKVSPIKVAIAQIPDKKVRVRGQRRKTGVRTGGKKAFVYLKKGDKIEFV
jgi:large subunit ribosomal protein L23